MSGTTTLGLPYPSLTDAPDVPADMQALAEAVDANFAAPATPATAWTGSIGTADVNVSNGGWTTIASASVDTTGAQTLLVLASVKVVNSGANTPNVELRLTDHTASDVTIGRVLSSQYGASGGTGDTKVLHIQALYTCPSAGGARTLRVQAGADAAGMVAKHSGTFNTESTDPATISVAVIK